MPRLCNRIKTTKFFRSYLLPVKVDVEMDPLDQVLDKVVGSHGLWQWSILLIGVIGLPTYELFSVFGNSQPLYRCRLPDPLENILHNVSVHGALDIIWGMNTTERAEIHTDYPKQCYHRLTHVAQLVHENLTDWTTLSVDQLSQLAVGKPVMCNGAFVYEPAPNQYPTSVIASFNLTCERAWLAPFTTTMFMIGMLFGYYLGGWAGDRFGRRPTVIFWFALGTITGYLTSFAPNVACLCLAQFILGAADSARLTVLFVQIFEMTTARWRSIMCSSWTVLQSFGTRAFTALLAYLLPDWHWLIAGMTAVGTIGILYICVGLESPRWLVARGRVDEAMQIFETGYRYNHCCRRATPETFTASDTFAIAQMHSVPEADELNEPSLASKGCRSTFCESVRASKFWKLFSSPELLKRLAFGSIVFLCHIYSYYGIMLYGNKVRGLVYVVVLVNASTALPGTVISCILYRVFRWRKRPLLGVFAVAFLCSLLAAVWTLTHDSESDLFLIITVGITLAMLESALDMIYIYIPELFPTIFRSQGLGFCAGFARIGSAMCSFTNDLDDSSLGHGSPIAFYCGSIFVAILAVLALPDTKGENLEETLEKKVHFEQTTTL